MLPCATIEEVRLARRAAQGSYEHACGCLHTTCSANKSASVLGAILLSTRLAPSVLSQATLSYQRQSLHGYEDEECQGRYQVRPNCRDRRGRPDCQGGLSNVYTEFTCEFFYIQKSWKAMYIECCLAIEVTGTCFSPCTSSHSSLTCSTLDCVRLMGFLTSSKHTQSLLLSILTPDVQFSNLNSTALHRHLTAVDLTCPVRVLSSVNPTQRSLVFNLTGTVASL